VFSGSAALAAVGVPAIDPDGNPPDGLIFHASGPIDSGWGVLDFWESREHFDGFADEGVGPAMAAIGATGAPDMRDFPVHEHFPRSQATTDLQHSR
jgi:hypothetical protein